MPPHSHDSRAGPHSERMPSYSVYHLLPKSPGRFRSSILLFSNNQTELNTNFTSFSSSSLKCTAQREREFSVPNSCKNLTIVPGKKKKKKTHEELDWLLPRSRTLARSKKNDASKKKVGKRKTAGRTGHTQKVSLFLALDCV